MYEELSDKRMMSSHVWLILTRASRENLAHGLPMAALGVQKSLIDQGFWWTHLVCLQVWCLGTIRRVMSTSLKNLTLSQSVRLQEKNREEVSIIFFPKSHETSLICMGIQQNLSSAEAVMSFLNISIANSPKYLKVYLSSHRWTTDTVRHGASGDGGADSASTQHSSAVHEEHAWQLHQTQAHPTRRLHLCWYRSLGPPGQLSLIKNVMAEDVRRRNYGLFLLLFLNSTSLQDGSYNYVDFTSTFEEYEIQRVMRAYENSITINLHCCAEGDWQQDHINKEQFSEFCQVNTTFKYYQLPR